LAHRAPTVTHVSKKVLGNICRIFGSSLTTRRISPLTVRDHQQGRRKTSGSWLWRRPKRSASKRSTPKIRLAKSVFIPQEFRVGFPDVQQPLVGGLGGDRDNRCL